MPDRVRLQYRGLTFDATAELAERWVDELLDAGALSVDAIDAAAGTAAEVPAYGEVSDLDATPWPVIRLTALFGGAAHAEDALAQAAAALGEPLPAYSLTTIPGVDWVHEAQAQFAPIRATDRLWIVPSWCTPPDPQAIVVRLDPGLAFGTGAHPSTLLCLRWLSANLPRGASVLDYGCGSGILAIAAAKLGAAGVTGIDVDRRAIATSRANAAANGVAAEFGLPDAFPAKAVDVVIANILANPLEILAPLLAGRVRDGGHIVLSGILEAQARAVGAAYRRWFNIEPWGTLDGWAALAGVRVSRSASDSPNARGDG
ncbi:MAG TPA: 50S ribosomal protein L11 methyltransferase [Casimicrobiaceae bacterium]